MNEQEARTLLQNLTSDQQSDLLLLLKMCDTADDNEFKRQLELTGAKWQGQRNGVQL